MTCERSGRTLTRQPGSLYSNPAAAAACALTNWSQVGDALGVQAVLWCPRVLVHVGTREGRETSVSAAGWRSLRCTAASRCRQCQGLQKSVVVVVRGERGVLTSCRPSAPNLPRPRVRRARTSKSGCVNSPSSDRPLMSVGLDARAPLSTEPDGPTRPRSRHPEQETCSADAVVCDEQRPPSSVSVSTAPRRASFDGDVGHVACGKVQALPGKQ